MRFHIALLLGIIVFNVFNFLYFIFPFSLYSSYFCFLWFVQGFGTGLVVGSLTKDIVKGILGGLVSVWIGPWSVLSGLLTCLPAVSGGALGAFFSENASQIREFIVKRKRTTILLIAVVFLSLMTLVASVMLVIKISHERCDGLVRLLEDQYSYEVAEEPMEFREEAFQPIGPAKLIYCGDNDGKFVSELLNTTNVSRLCYFKTPTGAYLWFLTGTQDRLVYVKYGFWQFEPITHGFDIPWSWTLTLFVLPTLILISVALISAKIEKPEETIAAPQLRPFPMDKYPEELAVRYQRMYPHNPAGVLEFHISRKIREGKTREHAIEELIKESG